MALARWCVTAFRWVHVRGPDTLQITLQRKRLQVGAWPWPCLQTPAEQVLARCITMALAGPALQYMTTMPVQEACGGLGAASASPCPN